MSANRNNDLPMSYLVICEIHPKSHYNKNKSAESRPWHF